jgi:hypothetical protein
MNFSILPSGNLLITADNRDREELAYDLNPTSPIRPAVRRFSPGK